MNDASNSGEKGFVQSFKINDGKPEDIDFLPKNLGMPKKEKKDDNPLIVLGDLEFDYKPVKAAVTKGSAKLRLVKDIIGKIIGFTVITPGKFEHTINMLWVDPQYRKGGLGSALLKDAADLLPEGKIIGDIWGGEPMVKLAQKLGGEQDIGGNMTNRFSYIKQYTGK